MTQEKLNQPLQRRKFIQSAAISGGTFAIAKNAMAQSANETLQIAVLGTGTQGQELINACLKTEGVQVKAVCDIWESYNLKRASGLLERFKIEHAAYADYQDMLANEKDLDAVLIATPDFCHEQQTIDCMKAGLNVYCESMMSNTIDGARAMAKSANESGKLLQIGFQRRSNPYYNYAFEHVIHETKMLGQIVAANGQWNRPVQTERGFPRRSPVDEAVLQKYGYESMRQFRNWMWDKKLGGGPVAELASHQIDAMIWFLETTPKSVFGSGGTEYYDAKTYEWPDTAMGIYEFETPKNMVRAFYQTINANSNYGYFENFMGNEGTLYVSEAPARVTLYREPAAPDWDRWVQLGIVKSPIAPAKAESADSGAVATVTETAIPPNYNLPVEYNETLVKPHLENFFQSIQGKAKLTCPPEIGIQATVAVLKFQDAIQNGGSAAFTAEDFSV